MKKLMPALFRVFSAVIVFALLFLNGCQKNLQLMPDDKTDLNGNLASSLTPALLVSSSCNGLNDSMLATNNDKDSIERQTVLGVKHVNPYLIPNMQKAYANLGITNQSVTVTNQYVRFLPNSAAQLGALDSIMDVQGLDLFDTPMDYDVTEGDYYQDPSIPIEQVTWQYAVVPSNFIAPAGIRYEQLTQIHIPGDDYTAVETEAERLAALQDCGGNNSSVSSIGAQPQSVPVACPAGSHMQNGVCVPDGCNNDEHWDATRGKCVANCSAGYRWTGSSCVLITNPPAPAPDAAIPAGKITVSDLNYAGTTNANQPVRNLRVIVKRWFKIQRLYTDINGNFIATKRFKHNVKVIVKFKNSDATIKTMRASKLWQMQLPMSKKLGVYGSNKNTIAYNFGTSGTTFNLTNRNWAAATINNSVQEYKDYAVSNSFSSPPASLNICLRFFKSDNSGTTPLFGKRAFTAIPMSWVTTFAYNSYESPSGGYTAALAVISAINLDMLIEYNVSQYSDGLKEAVYHELSHTSQYIKAGAKWYTNFLNSELAELQGNQPSSAFSPYGRGDDSNSPIIALGEGWAYFMGHYLADKRYGNKSSQAIEQGIKYDNGTIVSGLSSHLNLLEDFSPTRTNDPFHWIPQGLFYDLTDDRNDNLFNPSAVSDQVSNYSIPQMFNAFSSSITTLPAYRANLLQLNGNNQSSQVTLLFSQYGY